MSATAPTNPVHLVAARLFVQAEADPDKAAALVEAAAMLAVSMGHPLAAKRFRTTLGPTLARQRRNLDRTSRKD